MFEIKCLFLFINLFEGSTNIGNANSVSFWNTSVTQENQVGSFHYFH